jgi:hypothetical protein
MPLLTVRLKWGSTSCTTCIHREDAHSTLLCCRNRINLQGDDRESVHQCAPCICETSHPFTEVCQWMWVHHDVSKTQSLAYLCAGAACALTMRMMSSGVLSASPFLACSSGSD